MIHLGRLRAEDQVCSQAFAEFAVTLKVSRVGFQILGRTELCRIDEIGYHYDIILLSAFLIRLACPSWRNPMVGTRPTVFLLFPRFDLFSCFFYCFCYLHCALLFSGSETGFLNRFEIASFLNSPSSYYLPDLRQAISFSSPCFS